MRGIGDRGGGRGGDKGGYKSLRSMFKLGDLVLPAAARD